MKKQYMKPQMEVADFESSASLLTTSGGIYSEKIKGNRTGAATDDIIISYGGVDEDGDIDPE